jgi:hypothetical protein
MGNAEICGGIPVSHEVSKVKLIGHIKNSQTRGLMAVLEACKIKYIFEEIDVPKKKKPDNNQGVQG